jgi:rhamnose transport system permease protein
VSFRRISLHFQKWLRWAWALWPVFLLVTMFLVNPRLVKPAAWDRMGRNWAGVALLAIGLTPIVITGGIDLSVGSVVGLSAVATGFLWRDAGLPIGIALAGSVLTGTMAGAINGTLVLAGISPLVVTLATLAVFRGLAYGLSGSRVVEGFPAPLSAWWEGTLLGLPYPVWLVLAGFVLVYVFLHHTWMGRMLFAIGDNPAAARFAGVPVRTLTFSLYVISGLIAGVVGLTKVCEFPSAPPNQGENLELLAVACVVLGGVRITGGAGHLAGTMLGTLTLAVLVEGMAGILAQWRPVLTGVFLVTVAIANETLSRFRAEKMTGPLSS